MCIPSIIINFNRSETESEIWFRNILASFNIKITELSIGVKISYEKRIAKVYLSGCLNL